VRSVLVAAVLAAAIVTGACGRSTEDVVPVAATEPEVVAEVEPPVAAPATDAASDAPAVPAVTTAEQAPTAPVPTVTFQRHVDEPDRAYRIDVALPVVTGVAPEVASAVEGHVRAWVEDTRAGYLRDEAEFNPTQLRDDRFPPGALEITGVAGEPNPALLSLLFTVTAMHQGAAHPLTTIEAFTFDLATGAPVELAGLFTAGAPVLTTVSEEVVPALVVQLDPGGEGWAEAGVREGAGPDADVLRRFVVGGSGLTVHFDQYQVAPGAAGTLQVTVPWERLIPALRPSPLLEATLAALR
jgi:hypothetical protein